MLKFLLNVSSIAALLTPLVMSNSAIALPRDPDLYCFQTLPNGQVVDLQGICTRTPEANLPANPQAKPAAPSPKSGAQTKTNSVPYPASIAQSFINSCAKSAPKSICTCAFKKIESRYSLQEFIQVGVNARTGQGLPDEMRKVIVSCVQSS